MLFWLQLFLYGMFTLVSLSWLLLVTQRLFPRQVLDAPVSTGREILRAIAALTLGPLLFGSTLPLHLAGELDPSWQLVLEHATANKLLLGKDIIFTYGPLAPASTDLAVATGLFAGARAAYGLWLASVFVLFWWRLSLEMPAWLATLSWIWLALLPSDGVPYVALALLAWGMRPQGRTGKMDLFVAVIVAPAGLATLGAVKFTYMVAASAVVAAWLLHAVVFERAWRRAVITTLAAATTFALAWSASSQPLSLIPTWMFQGLRVSSAYADAMQVFLVSPASLILSTSILGLSIIGIAVVVIRQALQKNAAGVFQGLVCMGILAIVWKHSATRADGFHLTMINLVAPVICCLAFAQAPGAFNTSRRWTMVLAPATLLFLICAMAGRQTIAEIPLGELASSQVALVKQKLERIPQLLPTQQGALRLDPTSAPELAEYKLPRIQESLNGQPVDVFNFLQSTAFANRLNFQPRPVFQSYQACSPHLMETNRSYWEPRLGSHHLLTRMESIDGRLVSSEDATCWPLWLLNLVPSETENDFILLSPSGKPTQQPKWQQLAAGTAQLDTPLSVPEPPPGTMLRLRATPKRTAWGTLVKAAFQPEALRLTTRMKDGTPNITRIIPGALEAGVLLAPYLDTNVDLLAFYGKDEVLQRRPATITLLAESGSKSELAPAYAYVWETAPAPEWPAEIVSSAQRLLRQSRIPFPGRGPGLFGEKLPGGIMQLSLTSLISADVDGVPSLRLDVPSKLVFQNDRRGGTLQISYMVPDKSWKRKKPTDGVRFVIATADHQGQEKILLNDFLDPAARTEDRLKKTFTVQLPPNEHPWLVFRTETGPTDYQDRAIWSGCTWTPAATPAPQN